MSNGANVVAYEVYGTRVSVSVARADLVPQVAAQLPVNATPCAPSPGDRRFALEIADDGTYAILCDGTVLGRPPELEGALQGLRIQLFFHAMKHARDRLVVHAGVVGHVGRAIVLPGPRMIGKTTLVAALLRAGATYYADDWAVLDGQGLVHPFPTRLFIKGEDDLSPESLGGVTGGRPIPVGLIASIAFRDGASWRPRRRTPGEGVLMLLRNAYGMDAPDVAIQSARSAAAGALVLEGERGDAAETAAALLESSP